MNRPATIGLTGLIALVALAGCQTTGGVKRQEAQPDVTTYPRDRIVKVRNQINIPLGALITGSVGIKGKSSKGDVNERMEFSPGLSVLSFDVNTEKEGDDAITPLWIVPRNRAEFREDRLFARIPDGGRSACKGDYRIHKSTYFYGTEATLRFLGIETPALRVMYRCPAELNGPLSPAFRNVQNLSRKIPDSAFFDISSARFASSKAELRDKFLSYLNAKRMPIVEQGQSGSYHYVIAGKQREKTAGGRIERVVAVIGGDTRHATLTFRHFAYQFVQHMRGVLQTERRGFVRGPPQPFDRKVAYQRSVDFLAGFQDASGLLRSRPGTVASLTPATPKGPAAVPTSSPASRSRSEMIADAQCGLLRLGHFPPETSKVAACDGRLGPMTRKAQDRFNQNRPSAERIDLWSDLTGSLERLGAASSN